MKKTIYLFGLLTLIFAFASCNFIDDAKNQYSYQTLATLVASDNREGGTFIADGGIKLIAENYVKPDSIAYNTRFLLAFSVWDYNMNNQDSTWIVNLSGYRIVPEMDMFQISSENPEPAASQQLYNFEYCSLYQDLLTISCFTFQAKEKPDQLMLTYDNSKDSIGSDGNYYVNLVLKHYTPSLNAHSYKWQLNSYNIGALKEAYAEKTDTLYVNFTYTVEKDQTIGLKYALH